MSANGTPLALAVEIVLTPDQLDPLADAVAEPLRPEPAPGGHLVSAAQLAEALGLSRDYVYEHARELGGVQVGDGPRPRWRFPPEARGAWRQLAVDTRTTPQALGQWSPAPAGARRAGAR